MILITLGTQDKEFTRLLEAVDNEIKKKNIKEKVIVQAGYTKYESKNMEIFDLTSSEELEKLVKECRVLITHGGVGSILMGIKNNKPIIAAARLKEHKEHTNDHQKQIIKEFVNRGYILELDNFKDLGKLLKEVDTFKQKKFKSNNKNFIKKIDKYIEEDDHTSYLNKYLEYIKESSRGFIITLNNIISFYLLYESLDIFSNIILSFIISCFIGLLICKYINILNIKKYLILNMIYLVFTLLLMFIFISYSSITTKISFILTNLILLVIIYLIIKLINKKRKK